MNIDEITIKQAREIAALFGNSPAGATQPPAPHPFVGRYCILRCAQAGVHAGVLVSQDGDRAVLRSARRLWSWKAQDGVALSGVAINGLAGGKIDTLVPDIALTGVIETIPCSDYARESIHGAK